MKIDPDRITLTQHLHTLLIDYWHDVDSNWGRNAPDYYTEDAEFVGSKHSYKGKEKIREFYKWREDRGARTVIHAVQNFQAEFDGGPDRSICRWFLFLYAADGQPVLPSAPAVSVTLTTDRLVRTGEGWLVRHRQFVPWFKGGETTNPDLGTS